VKPAFCFLLLAAVAVAEEHSSTRDGVYTEQQADRGQSAYKQSCAKCHGETLKGKGATTPPLAGPSFMANWEGQTVFDLFEKTQTTMPADHPGSLSRAENTDILAYILECNKLPAGKRKLANGEDALKQIKVEAAK